MPKVGGPFLPIPVEVIALLRPFSAACTKDYLLVINDFFMEYDGKREGIWVVGRFSSTADEVARRIGVSRGWFRLRVWPTWIEIGIVREVGSGVIELPMLYKKGDMYQMPLPVRNELNELRDEIQTLRSEVHGSTAVEEETKPSHLTLLDADKDKEEVVPFEPVTEENYPPPGSRDWIVLKIAELWPGRDAKSKKEDGGYIDQMEKYAPAQLEAAFSRATADKVKYGNFDYLLNYLRNPALYNRKRRGKKGSKKPERDPDIGTLEADWYKEDEEGN